MKAKIAQVLDTLSQPQNRLWLIGLLMLALMIPMVFAAAQNGVAPTAVPSDSAERTAGEIVNFTAETAQATANTLQDFINRLIQTPKSDVARILLIIGGVILLVAGWRIYDFVTLLAGFLIGALVALSLLNTDNTLITIGAILVGGVIGAAIGYFVYIVAVFLIGAYLGIVIASALAFRLALSPISPLVLLIAALLGGLLLTGLSFQFLILLSALVGAQMLTLGFGLSPEWTLILAVIGIIAQIMLARYYNYDFRRRPARVFWYRRSAV